MVRRMVQAAALVVVVTAAVQLKEGFYDSTCPQAEKIIKDYVKMQVMRAPDIAATLLRTHFHNCFVRGCDTSVRAAQRDGRQGGGEGRGAQQDLRGFVFIDRIKALLEKEWPGVVSCADIIALSARDSVVTIGGPSWSVLTGRRDGTVSIKQEALEQIPQPTMNFTTLLQSFQNKSLSLADLVWLSGAHTIGVSHCNCFSEPLYNFTGRGPSPTDADPSSLDPAHAAKLRRQCKTLADNTTTVQMDPGSFRTFDLSYYRGLLKRRGLFQSDAALITHAKSKADILAVINKNKPSLFFQAFASSMVRMGAIEVKTGSQGEIRKHCAFVNKPVEMHFDS